jgi:hypothetical protein
VKDKIRLFYIAGPAQALNVMSILYEDGISSGTYDIALIGGFTVNAKNNKEIMEATTNIIKTHNWAMLKDISPYESKIEQLYNDCHYKDCEYEIAKMTNTERVNELYILTNSRSAMTIMITRTYECFAKISIYGDAFGIIDSSIGNNFSKIDEVRVFLPIEYNKGFLTHIPLRIMRRKSLLYVIDNYLAVNREIKSALTELGKQVDEDSVLITTVQFAEWNMMDLEDEIDMYVKSVVRNVKPGCKVFIKEHPRVVIKERVYMLMKRLTDSGYKCVHINNAILRFAPVECICRKIKFKLLISTASTSGLSVKYLFNYPVDLGVDVEDISNFKRGDYLKIFITGMKKALDNLQRWDMKSILYSFVISPHNYMESNKVSDEKKQDISVDKLFEMLNKKYYRRGKRLSDEIKKLSVKSLAVYGMGRVGNKIAVDFVFDNDLEVYLLDTFIAGKRYYTKAILAPEELRRSVDCVLITVLSEIGIQEIKKTLDEKHINAKRIITIFDLIGEC